MALQTLFGMLLRKTRSPARANLASGPLLPLLLSLSQAFNSGVSRSRRVTDGMVLRGTRQLQALHTAAPRFFVLLERLVPDNPSARPSYTEEELTLMRAFIELLLGWISQLLSQLPGHRKTGASFIPTRARCPVSHKSPLNPRNHSKCPTPA